MVQYVPWYLKRSPPIFCGICLPVYNGVWPARKFVLIIGAILFAIGIMLLLGLLLTCIAVECSIVAGALLPFALVLIIAGLLIIHCGWAAHLLEYGHGGHLGETTTTTTSRTKRSADGGPNEDEDLPIFETIEGQQPQQEIKQGFWQFEEKSAWQSVANPYPIQYSLKPVVDRQPYI
uniref:Uncharacterized protein n=1 Tax=Ditylenchus dipsaci TaxID=166011 RepID=A0A915ER20_9BILA